MDAIETGLLLLFFLLFLLLFPSFKMYKMKCQLPPGPTPWLFLGNVLQKDVLPLNKFHSKLIEKHGPIFTIWMGSKPAVVLCTYEVVKDALVDHIEEFGGRSDSPITHQRLKDQGLSSRNDAKWREFRRFTLSTLRNFGMGKRTMSERVQEEAIYLAKDVAEAIQEKRLNIRESITNAVSNVICSVVFGKRFNYQDEMITRHLRTVEQLVALNRSYTGMFYSSFFQMMYYLPGPHEKIFADCEKVQAYIHEEVKSHRCTLDPENPRDYIDCFLLKMEKENISPEVIYSEGDLVTSVFSLFAAGTTSTSNVLHFGIFAMARLPHIQEKVQEEIDKVVGISRAPGMEDRVQMPFTNAVVHECQRMQNPRLENFARSTTCCVEFRGFTIPQGTSVIPNIASVHFDPLHWETPQKFNPAHFLNEKGQFKKNNAFMPFSAGKRACPGEALAQVKLFLFFSILLQNFSFQLSGEATDMNLLSFYNKHRENNQALPIQAIKR